MTELTTKPGLVTPVAFAALVDEAKAHNMRVGLVVGEASGPPEHQVRPWYALTVGFAEVILVNERVYGCTIPALDGAAQRALVKLRERLI